MVCYSMSHERKALFNRDTSTSTCLRQRHLDNNGEVSTKDSIYKYLVILGFDRMYCNDISDIDDKSIQFDNIVPQGG